MKVNLGCGQAYMEGWTNVDASPDVKADIHLDAADFVRQYGDQVDEVYMGHVMEHLMPAYAATLLRLLNEKLRPGTVISVVTPDMRAIFEAYLAGEISNDKLNASFIYSYVQPSHHIWCYDEAALLELFRRAGLSDIEPIADPRTYPPVYHKEGPESQWQCGVRARAVGRPVSAIEAEVNELDGVDHTRHIASPDEAVTPEHLLLQRVENLRAALIREHERRTALEARVIAAAPDDAAPVTRARRDTAAPVQVPTVGGRRTTPGSATEPQLPASESAPVEALSSELAPSDASPTPAVSPSDPVVAPTSANPAGLAKAKALAWGAATRVLPQGSRPRAAARASVLAFRETRKAGRQVRRVFAEAGVVPESVSYRAWCKDHDVDQKQLKAQREASRAAAAPLRVLVAVMGGGDGENRSALDETIASVRAQSWQHWSIAVCSPKGSAPQLDADDRIEVRVADTAVTALHRAIESTDADFAIIIDAGDRLSPECIYQIARAAWQDPLVDLVCWDDDLAEGQSRHNPRFRPSWSPEMLLGANYLAQSFAMRVRRIRYAGGVRNSYGEAMRWDLLLRAGLDADRVVRVPRVLAHVKRRRDIVDSHGVLAVQSFLDSQGIPAVAELASYAVRLKWNLESWPKVSVVIPTRHNRPMLSTVLPGLARTDYPSFEVRIIDNGGESEENNAWYAQNKGGLDLHVQWSTATPFNYSQVNNTAVVGATGEVFVFLNDDIELPDPGWMKELVGWAMQPGIGTAGLQMVRADGRIQHTGVIVGMSSLADHVFAGMLPGTDSMLGCTGWYRNTLAVTGACMAIRKQTFEHVGGFDERFILCGSDVTLGLDVVQAGFRNVCSPFGGVRHLESATRGTHVPVEDVFTSYWRYNSWIFGGDPYYSPNLSLSSTRPKLRTPLEPTPAERLAEPLGRKLQVFRQTSDTSAAVMLADECRVGDIEVAAVEALHERNRGRIDVRSINWYIPGIDSPFYGGINTALRMADYLKRNHDVENRFVVWGAPPDTFVRSALTAAFPSLSDSPISFFAGPASPDLENVAKADVSISTLWLTAYAAARADDVQRKFYLIQDFEPMFYPAGSEYALAEETYRFGFYGLCNTDNLRKIYADDYSGKGMSFMPAVDPSVFHANNRPWRDENGPVTVFVYARPGHWRNCWELASLALRELKDRLGDNVRIVTAGSWATDPAAADAIKQLGLLSYKATGELYRRCDIGLALTVSKHPSYLPLELMACGVPVVAFDNPWGHWILKDGENSVLARRTVPSLVDAMERLCVNPSLREKLSKNALNDIAAAHGNWDSAFSGIYDYLCDPGH